MYLQNSIAKKRNYLITIAQRIGLEAKSCTDYIFENSEEVNHSSRTLCESALNMLTSICLFMQFQNLYLASKQNKTPSMCEC